MQSGPKNANEKTQGVNFRALGDLFKLAEQRKGMFVYEIAVQMIEIYNEQVRDLLVSDGLNKRYPFNLFLLKFIKFVYLFLEIPSLCNN
jgi:Kinesin motor domain